MLGSLKVQVGDRRVSWLGRTLKSWLATFLREGKLWCKSRLRKALYPWLATLLREENTITIQLQFRIKIYPKIT